MLTGPPEDTVPTASGHSSTWQDAGNSVQPLQVPQNPGLVTPVGLEIEGLLSELLILQGKLAGPLCCLLSPWFSPLLSWKGVGFQGSKAGRDWARASDSPSALEVTQFLLPDRSGDFLLMG